MEVFKKTTLGRTLRNAAYMGSCICIGACTSALLFPIAEPVTSLQLATASTLFSTVAAAATSYAYESGAFSMKSA